MSDKIRKRAEAKILESAELSKQLQGMSNEEIARLVWRSLMLDMDIFSMEYTLLDELLERFSPGANEPN